MANEVKEVGDITEDTSHVCGVLSKISPIKKWKDSAYFDGEIRNQNKKGQVYDYDTTVRKRLLESDGSAVVLGRCKVKKGRYNDDYEVYNVLKDLGLDGTFVRYWLIKTPR